VTRGWLLTVSALSVVVALWLTITYNSASGPALSKKFHSEPLAQHERLHERRPSRITSKGCFLPHEAGRSPKQPFALKLRGTRAVNPSPASKRTWMVSFRSLCSTCLDISFWRQVATPRGA
jgi:hypothetical protein